MSEEKKVNEMNEDELNKFLSDGLIEKFGLNDMNRENRIDDWAEKFPTTGSTKEKIEYLDSAVEKNIIQSYEAIDKSEETENCQFSIQLHSKDQRLIL
ncbi:hypothetical protein [Mucilaginibacter sp. 3215]|uniref:hypothetical protein n=1 Tax=Mucilaginibacter sp. 3215 TaxID=3373912 RepID=UPI003D204911